MMGSAFSITVVAEEERFAHACIDSAFAEIERIEKKISSWDQNSETSRINEKAGEEAVVVSTELISLIERSKKVSELSAGAFDISYASMDRVWKFDGSMTTLPEKEVIERSVEKVNYKDIIPDLAKSTVFLKKKGMKIGFGGIGKGYAANRTKNVLQRLGIENGVVNAGGDLTAWGKKANGKKWDIAIADPESPGRHLAWLEINDGAVVTSGNYERFAMIDGVRYAHIINPKTGYPVTGLKSVTILCPDAELADALATAVFVKGITEGLELINQLNGIEALLVTDEDELVESGKLGIRHEGG